jgi:hypothetical protein
MCLDPRLPCVRFQSSVVGGDDVGSYEKWKKIMFVDLFSEWSLTLLTLLYYLILSNFYLAAPIFNDFECY